MILVLMNMVLNVEHHVDFGKIMDGLILQIVMVGFSGILDTGRRSSDYEKRIVSRFKGKLVKMINGK